MKTWRRTWRWIASVMLALALSGCFNPFDPRIASTRGISEPPPRPDSPRNTLLLFSWCWEHRDYNTYRELFTDDFRFAFATTDTFGNAYLTRGWTREDELESAKHLFLTGKADAPVATRILLDFDANLLALPDSRPGKIAPWHLEIATRVTLSADYSNGTADRSDGSARFFLVRGDSALIPEELHFASDPNRWYIERYEEEDPGGSLVAAGGEGSLAAQSAPARSVSESLRRLETIGVTRFAGGAGTTSPRAGGSDVATSFYNRISWGHLKVAYR